MEGPVIRGRQIGRKLNLPTINQRPEMGIILPRPGVYLTRVTREGDIFRGVTNIGAAPTVDSSGDIRVETHILGFDGDMYGKTARIEFFKYLRPEQAFSSLEDLRLQIQNDIGKAEKLKIL